MKPSAALPPGALPLSNQRQEAFAVARARGLTLRLAYLEAGYSGGEANASALSHKKHVAERIAYLKDDLARSERAPGEAFDAAYQNSFTGREVTLPYYMTELRDSLSRARLTGNAKMEVDCLYLMGAASGLIKLSPPGRPAKMTRRGREAQQDHDGDKQQRASRALADAPEGEVSEVLGLVDQLGSGLGDEPEEEGPARD